MDCLDTCPVTDKAQQDAVIDATIRAAYLDPRSPTSLRAIAEMLTFGGDFALQSYGPDQSLRLVPRQHWAFLERLPLVFETERHFFLHANYDPNRPINEQDSQTVLWQTLENNDLPVRHCSGKTAIVGHTPQKDGKILDLEHLKCIDTGCGHGGLLTALDVNSGRIWQVDESGAARNG
jgi:serine/threonine protein phosphatase 1